MQHFLLFTILYSIINYHCLLGPNIGKESTPTSSSKKPASKPTIKEERKEEDIKKDKTKHTSFPPANTTDAVRLKCRELLVSALKTDHSKFFLFMYYYIILKRKNYLKKKTTRLSLIPIFVVVTLQLL